MFPLMVSGLAATYFMEPSPTSRTKFILPGDITEGTISVQLNAEPFHCTLKVTPTDPELIPAEGRYSDNELSLGKLRRNLVHLQFHIKDLEDILSAVESLEGRKCTFRIDKSGWISWIQKLIKSNHSAPVLENLEAVPVPAPVVPTAAPEIYFVRVTGHRSIYEMQDADAKVWGFAVGPTGSNTPNPHGWTLYIDTLEAAKEILKQRRQI